MTDIVTDIPNAAEPVTETMLPVSDPSVSPRLDAFFSIPVALELVLASVKMPVAKLMEMQVGTEIDLNHPAGTEVALVVNGSKIAFGHLFLIDTVSRRVGLRVSRLAAPGGET